MRHEPVNISFHQNGAGDLIIVADQNGMKALSRAMDVARNKGAARMSDYADCMDYSIKFGDNDYINIVLVDQAHIDLLDEKFDREGTYAEIRDISNQLLSFVDVPEMEGAVLDFWTAISMRLSPELDLDNVYITEDGERKIYSPSTDDALCETLKKSEGVVVTENNIWGATHPRIEFFGPVISCASVNEAVCRAIVSSRFGSIIRFPEDRERSRAYASKEFAKNGITPIVEAVTS